MKIYMFKTAPLKEIVNEWLKSGPIIKKRIEEVEREQVEREQDTSSDKDYLLLKREMHQDRINFHQRYVDNIDKAVKEIEGKQESKKRREERNERLYKKLYVINDRGTVYLHPRSDGQGILMKTLSVALTEDRLMNRNNVTFKVGDTFAFEGYVYRIKGVIDHEEQRKPKVEPIEFKESRHDNFFNEMIKDTQDQLHKQFQDVMSIGVGVFNPRMFAPGIPFFMGDEKKGKEIEPCNVMVNPVQSEIVQEFMFKKGWKWPNTDNNKPLHTNMPVLSLMHDKRILYGISPAVGMPVFTFEQFEKLYMGEDKKQAQVADLYYVYEIAHDSLGNNHQVITKFAGPPVMPYLYMIKAVPTEEANTVKDKDARNFGLGDVVTTYDKKNVKITEIIHDAKEEKKEPEKQEPMSEEQVPYMRKGEKGVKLAPTYYRRKDLLTAYHIKEVIVRENKKDGMYGVIIPHGEYPEIRVTKEFMLIRKPQAGGYYIIDSGGDTYNNCREFEETCIRIDKL